MQTSGKLTTKITAVLHHTRLGTKNKKRLNKSMKHPLLKRYFLGPYTTVDGRNPAPPGMYQTLSIMGRRN